MTLDEYDQALLAELGRDGRASFESLGARVGLSRTAARARVQKILDAGVVHVEAIVHPVVDGIHTFAHVSVVTDGASGAVAREIARLADAPFVSVVAGRYSVIAELRTGDLAEMASTVRAIRAIPGVKALDTVVYTELLKDSHLPLRGPQDVAAFELDDIDRQLLGLLQEDAQMPYAGLADRVALSRGATRTRVLRLLRDGVVVVSAMTNPTAFGMTQMCGFQVNLDGDGDDAVTQIEALDTVYFLARTLGRCDLIGTLIARTRADIGNALDAMRALVGVRSIEVWWHIELVKERYARRGGAASSG
ncbi:MAG: Lrp/AsnC family transcriptional regulator [Haloechinothrix sp.]